MSALYLCVSMLVQIGLPEFAAFFFGDTLGCSTLGSTPSSGRPNIIYLEEKVRGRMTP